MVCFYYFCALALLKKMYAHLLTLHSLFRWLVLLSLLYTIVHSYIGYRKNRKFSKADNAIRHWTATIAHVQLILGILMYIYSPIVKHFWGNVGTEIANLDVSFYGLIHSLLMLTAIVVITIGSALAKRRSTDSDKFKTILVWFTVALLIIFIAIPWPFSPLSSRPYFR